MPLPLSSPIDRPLPISTILIMLAKGMAPREIARVFPELTLDDIRNAVLQAAELMKDPEVSLAPSDASVREIIATARRSANLSAQDAMELAVYETRAHRREKAAR